MESLVARARAEGSVRLVFSSAREAAYLRQVFYLWRSAQRRLGPEPDLSDIVVSRPEPNVLVISSGWRDPIIRKAMETTP
jgi:hypothetical protein